MALLAAQLAFTALPAPALGEVAEALSEERYEPGEVVLFEGEVGDRLVILASGQAELSSSDSKGQVPIAVLGPDELVGELSLLAGDETRNAQLTALTPLVAMSLGREAFERVLVAHPLTRAAFEARAEDLLVARFIKGVAPFMCLNDVERRALAERLVRRSLTAGELIVRQGDPGDSCYLLRTGEAEVLLGQGGVERRVDVLHPGAIFGEITLLTHGPRSASVRTLVPCELLELRRDDLAAVLPAEHAAGHDLVQLLRLRERPRRVSGVLVFSHRTPEGEPLTVLKNPDCRTYHRLSERGRFIWERLDGCRNLRDLTLELYAQFGQLAPHAIADTLAGLARSRMIEVGEVTAGVGNPMVKPSRRKRLPAAARGLLEKQLWLNDIDRWLTSAYDHGVRRLFSRPAQVILAAVALTGLVAFGILATRVHHTLTGPHKVLLLLVIPGFLCATLVHECGHAFAVKAFGREVNRAGVGWYWFGPVAFVDTSDMWLGSRRERVLVSLAGPYTDMILAGVACLVAIGISSPTVSALLWSFALPAYLTVLANLNPLLEYDGYYVLSDLLDRPNLRAQALGWVGSRFPHLLRDREDLRRHRVDLLYGIAAVLYVLVAAVAMVVLYRLVLQGWIGTVLPASVAAALAWVFALLVSVLAAGGLIADLRRARGGPYNVA